MWHISANSVTHLLLFACLGACLRDGNDRTPFQWGKENECARLPVPAGV